jgi:hypothetical protein
MPNNRTLTASNAVLYLSVAGLFDIPQRIQGFSADDITDMDTVSPLESSMGVDKRLSFGFVPVAIPQTITLQADSQSNDFFEAVYSAQLQTGDTYIFNGTLLLPAVQRKYQMTRGAMSGYKPIAGAGRTLKPRPFALIWQSVTPAPS